MKKLLFFILLITSTELFSQATVDSLLYLKREQTKDSNVNGRNVKLLVEATANSLAPVVASTSSAVASLTNDTKGLNTRLQSTEQTVLNQSQQISNLQQQANPADILVNSPTLTIGSEHNGRTIKISSQCLVSFPFGLNIKCRIIRTAKGEVTITGSILTSQNYRRISGSPGRIDVDYTDGTALITGNLTK